MTHSFFSFGKQEQFKSSGRGESLSFPLLVRNNSLIGFELLRTFKQALFFVVSPFV